MVDFENFDFEFGEGLNGSDGSGGFSSGNFFLFNSYNLDFNFWFGWVIFVIMDVIIFGFMNDLSVIIGGGYNFIVYVVSFVLL